jgi:hypothetical protein
MASTSGAAALPATDGGEPPASWLLWARDRLRSLIGGSRSTVGESGPSDGRTALRLQSLPPPSWVERRCAHSAAPFGSAVDLAPPRPAPLAKPLTVAHYRTMARQVAYERQVALLDGSDVARAMWFADSTPVAGAQGRG